MTGPLAGITAGVITVSDRAATGQYADRSGPLAVELLRDAGAQVPDPLVVPDEIEAVQQAVRAAVADGTRLIVTTGGTGVAPRDLTPDAVAPLLRVQIPGIAEAIRAVGRENTPMADLSRGVAGVIGTSVVVTLAGSTGGVRDGIGVVITLAGHLIAQLDGQDH